MIMTVSLDDQPKEQREQDGCEWPKSPEVIAVFEARPPEVRSTLLTLRRLILDVAASRPEIGMIEETLKWGQPSYLPSATKSGTTIRIDQLSTSDQRCGLFVHCQTDLITSFKQIYPDAFLYSGTVSYTHLTLPTTPYV